MVFRNRIRELHVEKMISFRGLLIIELCLLMIGILGLFGKNTVYHFGPEAMTANFGSYSETDGGYSVTESSGQTGNLVDFAGIALPKGVYQIALLYDTDTNMENLCEVTDGSGEYHTLRCNGEHLYAGLHQTDFTMWLLTDKDNITVHVNYGGIGSLTVKGLQIRKTNALSRMWIFCVLVGASLVNAAFLFWQYDKQYKVALQTKNIIFGLGLVILFASLPIMMDRMIAGGDLIYHLLRIEGIKDGLLSGQFPVRIAPKWQQGYGYASSIFYGETVLYLAALFRLIGFSVVTSYRLFLLVITVATVLLSYYCFRKIFQNGYIGLLCSMLYSISVYRISKTYICGSLGETLGILFLPLLVWGFFRVFTEDIHQPQYRRAWLPLTIGFTGLIQSHLLTGEQVGFFTILLCLLLWKKVFRVPTFVVLAKTVIYSCLLSAWFLVPFADYMLRGDFVIQHVSGRTIQSRGLYPAHFLLTFFQTGSNVMFQDTGMYEAQPMGVGLSLMVALGIWLGLLFFHKTDKMNAAVKTLGKIIGAFAMLAMLMSLSVFPWDRIQAISPILATLVSSIQFPNRFLTIVTVCLTAVAGVTASWMCEGNRRRSLVAFAVSMVVLTLTGSIYLTNDMLLKTDNFQVYNVECIGSGYIAGAEYLPYGTDASQFVHRDPVVQDNIVVDSYEKKNLTIQVACHNDSQTEGAMNLPLLYYRGYQAQDVATGDPIPVYIDTNNTVGVAVPAGYHGTIQISFISPWYWRAAELLSVVTLFVLVAGCRWQIRRECREKCER